MNVHAAAICLHTVAVMKGERHEVPSHIVAESKMRCFTAAAEIGSIMRMIAHADFTAVSFPLAHVGIGRELSSCRITRAIPRCCLTTLLVDLSRSCLYFKISIFMIRPDVLHLFPNALS